MRVGLRIDVDTLRGTQRGVPALCRLLARHDAAASFFFSVGPDNMGRHLRRLAHPKFLWKMLRSNAPGLYGWDILLRGTFGPGPIIGRKLASIIANTAAAGHEIGFHAWDHYRWQTYADRMHADEIRESLARGVAMLAEAAGTPPVCSAVPGWRCTDEALVQKACFDFTYNSDCRGRGLFLPVVRGRALPQPQVPVSLPTYDELIGRNGITDANYNARMLSLIGAGSFNVLTIHAEVEGIARHTLFAEFVDALFAAGHTLVPLGRLIPREGVTARATIARQTIPGREGWVAVRTTEPDNVPGGSTP